MGERAADPATGTTRRLAPALWNAALVVVLLAAFGLTWWLDPSLFTPLNAVIAGASVLVLLWRRSAPLAVFSATATFGAASALIGHGGVVALPIAIASASVVATGRRRLGVMATAAVAALLVAILLLRGQEWSDTPVVTAVLTLALGVTAGLVRDGRRRIVQAAVDRAERAESLRDAEARRAVAEERLRIARDLHDVLAHQIAVIGVQTGVADYVLESDTTAARDALETARTATSSALRELATLLHLLRTESGAEGDVRAAPAPSLRRIDELIADVRATGLTVDAHLPDAWPPVSPGVEVAAYRVLQEGLTNAHKHGDGRARLTIRTDGIHLLVTIANTVSATRADMMPSGYGLIGMRERVKSVGGTVSASATADAFVLEAAFPVEPAAAAACRAPADPTEPEGDEQ